MLEFASSDTNPRGNHIHTIPKCINLYYTLFTPHSPYMFQPSPTQRLFLTSGEPQNIISSSAGFLDTKLKT